MSFPELDNHMFVERELMLVDADLHEAQQEVLAQEALDEQDREAGVLTDAEAEVLIRDYIRSDRSAKYIEDQIPY
jgi:hypothetical protein